MIKRIYRGVQKKWPLIRLIDHRHLKSYPFLLVAQLPFIIFYPFFYVAAIGIKIFGYRIAICLIPNSIGHVTEEVDYLVRKLREKDEGIKKIIYITPKTKIAEAFHNACKLEHKDVTVVVSTILFHLGNACLICCPSLLYDSSLSHYRMPNLKKYFQLLVNGGFVKHYTMAKTNSEFKSAFNHWCFLNQTGVDGGLKASVSIKIDKSKPNQSYEAFYGELLDGDKIALIHLKKNIGNANPLILDEEYYIGLVGFLKESGFKVAQLGEEPIQSTILKEMLFVDGVTKPFSAQFYLVEKSSFAIVFASGVDGIPMSYQIPTLFSNSWQLSLIVPTPYSLDLPSMVFSKKDERILSWSEQVELHDKHPYSVPPADRYDFLPPSQEDVRASIKRMMELRINRAKIDPWINEQRKLIQKVQPESCRMVIHRAISPDYYEKNKAHWFPN